MNEVVYYIVGALVALSVITLAPTISYAFYILGMGAFSALITGTAGYALYENYVKVKE